MKVSQGLSTTNSSHVCKLKKIIICPLNLKIQGYQSSNNDYFLQSKTARDLVVFLAMSVDDILVTSIDREEIQSMKHFLDAQFKWIKLNMEDGPLTNGPASYRCLVGKLNYLSQFKASPSETHVEAVKNTLSHMKFNPTQGMLMSAEQDYNLTAYCVSDWPPYPQHQVIC